MSGASSLYTRIADFETTSPYQGFYKAEMMLQLALVQLKTHEEWSAALSLRRAYLIIDENMERYPDFIPQNKTLGLLHLLIGSVP